MRIALVLLLLAVPCALGALATQTPRAREVFDRVLAGKAWTAFGFIAAEADVTRGF